MPQDTGPVSLTDLCTICHLNQIKYTCPRDGVQTCSLPCVKRHKRWAQCSGTRDPAEYRKRSELATASSVDKDFNFITNVERSISRADGVLTDRGIDLVPARFRPHDARPKYELEAEARGIKITKAPKGLSRNRQNKTHWGGSTKCIVWTVEWICQDGKRMISAAPENRSMRELYDSAVGPKHHSHNKKRKRGSDEEAQVRDLDAKSDKQSTLSRTATGRRGSSASQNGISKTTESIPNHEQDGLDEHADTLPPATSDSPQQFFYLFRPETESRYKCLIPISPDATSLREVLTGRTLIEFPTIYCLSDPPDQLKAPFITEDEYTRRHGVDIPINVSSRLPVDTSQLIDENGEVENDEVGPDRVGPSITKMKVLEVLAQDL